LSTTLPYKPRVLCISGLDPTGGAGIQADIETLIALGCHTLPVISSLTVQTTGNVRATQPCSPGLIRDQIMALLECGLNPDCIKLGLIDSTGTIAVLAEIIKLMPDVPVVADPVLKAGGGFDFSTDELINAYQTLLLPHCTVLTPNVPELYRLNPQTSSEDSALQATVATGCKHVLLTGTHADTSDVVNRLFGTGLDQRWHWPRLSGEFHGSGCTLAAAVAAGLAHGQTVAASAEAAQRFTWNALKNAATADVGQSLPDRRLCD
jgi:hydroxymethylpyrimidine/phosphomethylpyrimidine kinase